MNDDPSLSEIEPLARSLDTDVERGLARDVAERRLASHGPNQLRSAPPIPAWQRFLAQFRDPLIYLLLAAIVISAVAWAIDREEAWPVDALVIAAIVLINAALGFIQETKAHNAAAALARLTAVTSAVVRDGRLSRIPSSELVPGDVLVLAEGDAVGADARLFEAATLRTQEASLTGESEPVLKHAETLAGAVALADRSNMVFKGTAVVQGTGRALVTATGMDTQMGEIAKLLETTQREPTPLQREVARIGRALGGAVLAIAGVVVAAVLAAFDVDDLAGVVDVLLLGVSLAVAAVPEGLPAILSAVLAVGVRRMARRNAIVKDLASVETLGSASVICSDKTGTLTRSEMTIRRIVTASGSSDVTGIGYAPKGRVEHRGEPASGALLAEQIVVLSGGSLASNAELRKSAEDTWEILGDPTEAAFLVAERKLGATPRRERRFERIREFPFTSERKMMSTIALDHEHGGQAVLISKGAPDVLLSYCDRVREGTEVAPLDEARRAKILARVDSLSDEALRTIAVAYRPLAADEDPHAGTVPERDLIFVGVAGMLDPPREEAAAAIESAHRAGIRVIMITGDHPRTAARIASELGIVEQGHAALTGADLDRLDDAAFAAAVRSTSVYARVAPHHKLRIVDALQADGHVVAMTGDGVNDAPALKSADIGVAMGITGTEVAKEAAKMILADDNFATIVDAVRMGRVIFDNIKKFLRYLLSSNMGEVLTVFLGVLFAAPIGLVDAGGEIALPLLATQILWINLITDSGPALVIGLDPPTDDVMARKPRHSGDRVIDARMWVGVVEVGIAMALLTLLTIDLYLPGGFVDGERNLENARTAGFTVLVLAQLFNCFNARSDHASAFRGVFSNGWLWAAIAVSVALQVAVVNVEALNTAFGTSPLSAGQWAVCVALASAVLWPRELRKWLRRMRSRRPDGRSGTTY